MEKGHSEGIEIGKRGNAEGKVRNGKTERRKGRLRGYEQMFR